MNQIPKEVYSYVSSILKFQIYEDTILLETTKGLYLYVGHPAKKEVYETFDLISFEEYYSLLNSYEDNYQIFSLDSSNPCILNILLSLYEKSVHEVLYEPSRREKIYEKLNREQNRLLNYYYGLQDRIEEMYYPREPYYYLLLSISSIYHLLHLGQAFLEEWRECDPKSYREVLTIHQFRPYNFYGKVADVSFSRRDSFLYELANYYQMYFQEENVLEEIERFMDEFSVIMEEKFLFYSLISILWEIPGENLEEVNHLLEYVQKTYSYLLEKYKEDQERKESMLQKE